MTATARGTPATGGVPPDGGTPWRHRYALRAPTLRDQHAKRYVDHGLVVLDPDGPYPGVDGSSYHPGGLDENKGFPPLPVVLVASRGMAEVLAGWENFREMLGWVAGRGTTGTGALEKPPAAASARCVREDTILAHALGRPADLPAVATYLPADTFTSDVRYDVYAAMLEVAHSGQRASPHRVAVALAERAAAIPSRHWQDHYGGRGLPWAQAYLRRLDQTLVAAEDARSAAASLRSEDRQAIARQAAARKATLPAAGRPTGRRGSLPGPRRTGSAVRAAAPAQGRQLPPGPGQPPQARPASGPLPGF
jgi:hypothetical protein